MDAEKLRENAHKMVDFIADYYKSLESYPVLSQVKPGYLRELLPHSAPDLPESLQDVLDDIRQKIIPGITHCQSPNYFAYYPSNSSTARFLGEMLSAAFNIVGFSWVSCPATTELEVIVLDWLAKMLKLPDQFLSSVDAACVLPHCRKYHNWTIRPNGYFCYLFWTWTAKAQNDEEEGEEGEEEA
ncbi:tyrosine decarboxylase 1-like isoform X2 [Asparagus officinalis]|uniref:tyrosine decarboxylase 1-like isoform X2 n=1 Tax=Asparagus officinalis TaxID=4686 RepID=UPI00098E6A19|nr:tyrosine decarboxylase 1-like isoform X2 [Asparagus officinalis]